MLTARFVLLHRNISSFHLKNPIDSYIQVVIPCPCGMVRIFRQKCKEATTGFDELKLEFVVGCFIGKVKCFVIWTPVQTNHKPWEQHNTLQRFVTALQWFTGYHRINVFQIPRFLYLQNFVLMVLDSLLHWYSQGFRYLDSSTNKSQTMRTTLQRFDATLQRVTDYHIIKVFKIQRFLYLQTVVLMEAGSSVSTWKKRIQCESCRFRGSLEAWCIRRRSL